MSRPLCRGFCGNNGKFSIGSGIEDSLKKSYPLKDFSEIGFGHELLSPLGNSKTRKNLTLCLLKLGIAGVILLALFCYLFWATRISTSSQKVVYRGYQQLQEQLVADLSVVGEISLGIGKLNEIGFCPNDYENYVPCYINVFKSMNSEELERKIEYGRQCGLRSETEHGCMILPPRKYKIPLRWPTGRDFIWKYNVKITGQELSSGSLTKRMMVEEEQLSFHSDSLMVDGVEDYSHQIAEMIGLRNESNFNEAGVRTVLDIGCGFGSFGAHLFAKNLITMCIASYEVSGSQVQLTLERGLPAMIGSFVTKQLPYPNLAFDMIHCARCGIHWENNDGIFLVEIDRLLRPGGYFVWTSHTNTHKSLQNKDNHKKWSVIRDFTENICWDMLSQQDETIIWKKTNKEKCYNFRKFSPSNCDKSNDIESPYYLPLKPCIGRSSSRRWTSIENRKPWPFQVIPNSTELGLHDVHPEEFAEDSLNWKLSVQNYWSLLSPLIFSDHPKRPGDEDPSPPFNMLRNVLDMNAQYGGFNAALLDAGKSVWVMNVVPVQCHNYLPLIFDRGFIGVQHDWCEAFPTYPRTYDMVHAQGLLSIHKHHRCSLLSILLEIDRILRPEGWIIIRDTALLIETVRAIIPQLKWDARVIGIGGNKDETLLVCQKPFFKKQMR